MIFTETIIPSAFIVDVERAEDDRGSFARTWCQYEFERMGLDGRYVQCSTSCNRRAGTIRGLHYQTAPHLEAKIVRCTGGAIFDVIVDLRRDSPAFGRWTGYELSAENGRAVYIPEGVAHGFQSLVDGAEILYQISTYYAPEFAAGIRWDDPDIAIAWPLPQAPVISDRDRQLPYFADVFGLDRAPRLAVAGGAGR